jgi:TP901 family phage tail tape measure protein
MANENINLNVVVNGEDAVKNLSVTLRNLIATSDGLTRASRAMDARQRALSQSIGVTNKSLNEHAKSIRQTVANQKALSLEINNVTSEARKLNSGLKNINNTTQRMATRSFIKDLNGVARAMRGIKARALVSDLKSVSLQIKKMGKDAQFVGRSLIIGLTTPITLFARRGIDSFRSLNREIIRLQKIAGDSFKKSLNPQDLATLSKEFDNLGLSVGDATSALDAVSNTIYELSNATGISRDLLTGVTADFAELGIQNAAVLAGLTKLTAEMSILGSMDISESQSLAQTMFLGTIRTLDLMGREFKTMAEKQESALKSVNAQLYLFNAIENNTALSFRDMADSIPEASAAATSFGLSMTQAAALLAPMKAAGIDISTAATGLKVSLQRLVTPTVKTQKQMKSLVETYGSAAPNLEQAFSRIQGVGVQSLQGLIDTTMELRAVASDEEILSFYSNIFEKRQAPRMLIAIDSLVQFQKELAGTAGPSSRAIKEMKDALNGMIDSANRTRMSTVPLINNVEDFTRVAKIANSQAGEYVESIGRTVLQNDIDSARAVRKQLQDYVKTVYEETGIDVIDQISSQAGKGLFVEVLGAASAQALAAEELNTALEATYTQIDKIKNAFKNIAIEFVQAFSNAGVEGATDYFQKVADAMLAFAEKIKNLTPETKKFIAVAAGAAAALGPLVFVFGQMKLAVGVLSGAMLRLLPSMLALDATSLAAAPGLLRLRSSVISVGDGFTTSAGKFSRFVATLASGRGPIASIANQFGLMTGILKKDITADAATMARVNMPTAAGERIAMAIESSTNHMVSAQTRATQNNVAATVNSGNTVASAITAAGTQAAMAIQSAVGIAGLTAAAAPGTAVPIAARQAISALGTGHRPGLSLPIGSAQAAAALTSRQLEDIAIRSLTAAGYAVPTTPTGMLSMARGAVSTRAGMPDVTYDQALERARNLAMRGAGTGVSAVGTGALDVKGERFVTGQARGGAASVSRMSLLSGSGRLTYRAQQLRDAAEARALAAQTAAANAAQSRAAAAAAAATKYATPTYQSVLGIPMSQRGGMGAEDYLATQMTRKARFGRVAGRLGAGAGGALSGLGTGASVAAQSVASAAQRVAGLGLRGTAATFRGGARVLQPRPIDAAKAFRGLTEEQIQAQRDLRTTMLRSRGIEFDDQGRATMRGGFRGRSRAGGSTGAGRFVQNMALRRQRTIMGEGFLGRSALARTIAASDAGSIRQRVSRTGVADMGRSIATKASNFTGANKALGSFSGILDKVNNKQADLTAKAVLFNKKSPSAFRRGAVSARIYGAAVGESTLRMLLGNKAVDAMKAKLIGLKVAGLGSFGAMKAGVIGLTKSIMSMSNAMKIARTALLGAGVVTALLAIAGVVAVVVGNFDEIKTKVQPAMEAFKATLSTLKDIAMALIDPFLDFFSVLGNSDGQTSSVDSIANAFNGIASFVQKASEKVKSFVDQYVVPFIRKAMGAVNTIVSGFKMIVSGAQGMRNGAQGSFDQLKAGVAKVFDGIKQLFLGTLAPALVSGAAALLKAMYRIFIKLLEFMPQIIVGIIRLFVEFRMLALKILKFLVVGAARLFAQLPGFLGEVLSRMVHMLTEFVRGGLDALGFLGDAVGLAVRPVLAGLDVLSSGIKEVSGGVSAALGGVVNGLDSALDGLIGLADAATDFLGDAAMDLAGYFSNIIGEALDGTEDQFDSFIDKYRDQALEFLSQFKPDEISNDLGESLAGGIANAVKKEELADEIFEPIIDASSDAGQEAGENFSKKFKDAIDDLRQKFVDLVGDYFKSEIDKVADQMAAAIIAQRDSALAVFDQQLSVLNKMEKAEQSLMRTREYIAERKRVLDERQLNRENYIRNRALAIYEGRIDDARMLDLQEQKDKIDSASKLEDIDKKRNEELRKENLDFLREAIKDARKEAEDFFNASVEAFKESAKEITKFAPQTIEEYQAQLNALKDKATEFSTKNAEEFAKTFDSMKETIVEGMPNKVVGVFGDNLQEILDEAKTKYGLNNEEDSIIGSTLSLLTAMGDSFNPSGETGGAVVGEWSSLVTEIKEEISNTGAGSIKEVIDKHGPQEVLRAAIAFANESILREWRGTVGHIISEVDDLADMMDPMIAAVAQAQIQFEMLKDAATAAGSAISGAAAAGGGGGGFGGGAGGGGGGGSLFNPGATLALEEIDAIRANARNLISATVSPTSSAFSSYVSMLVDAISRTESLFSTNRGPGVRQSIYDQEKSRLNAMTGAGTGLVLRQFKEYIRRAYPQITLANGGFVPGYRSQGVPAMLHGGEYVINSKAVSNIGLAALQAMNNMRFNTPDRYSNGSNVTTINKTENINIYVDTFIGEDKWFNEMMDQYNIKMKPMNEKKRGGEVRVFDSYSYRAGR